MMDEVSKTKEKETCIKISISTLSSFHKKIFRRATFVKLECLRAREILKLTSHLTSLGSWLVSTYRCPYVVNTFTVVAICVLCTVQVLIVVLLSPFNYLVSLRQNVADLHISDFGSKPLRNALDLLKRFRFLGIDGTFSFRRAVLYITI